MKSRRRICTGLPSANRVEMERSDFGGSEFPIRETPVGVSFQKVVPKRMISCGAGVRVTRPSVRVQSARRNWAPDSTDIFPVLSLTSGWPAMAERNAWRLAWERESCNGGREMACWEMSHWVRRESASVAASSERETEMESRSFRSVSCHGPWKHIAHDGSGMGFSGADFFPSAGAAAFGGFSRCMPTAMA